MVTTVGHEKNRSDLLRNLLSLEHDAIAAYDAAVERLGDESAKKRLTEFRTDHERHISELAPHLQGMGEKVPDGPGKKSVLTAGKVRLGALAGDQAILAAMGTNEIETEAAYRTAAERDDIDATLADKLRRARDDEARHRQWIQERI